MLLVRHNNSMNGIDPVSYHTLVQHTHISHECVKQVVAPNNELSISFKYFLHSLDVLRVKPISLNCCWINESKFVLCEHKYRSLTSRIYLRC